MFANGFEDFIDGVKLCQPKELYSREINLEFVQWRHFDRIILNWLYSTLTHDIMSQIVGIRHLMKHGLLFNESSQSLPIKAQIMQLRLEFQTIKKGSESMMEYI